MGRGVGPARADVRPVAPRRRRQGLAFSPDGQMLALLSDRGRLEVWAVDTGERLMSIDGAHPGNGSDLAFLPDGSARHRRGRRRRRCGTVPSDTKLFSLVERRQARRRGRQPGWDAHRHRGRGSQGDDLGRRDRWEAPQLELPNAVTSIAFSPDGTELATGDANGIVRVFALRVDDLVRLARQRLSDTPIFRRDPLLPAGRLLGAAGGLPGHDRRGGSAAARVPGIRRR